MNYSQSTDRLNDFIRWSRNTEVRKRRLSDFKWIIQNKLVDLGSGF